MSTFDPTDRAPVKVEALPPDIEVVWGGGRRDSSGELAADTASFLIDAWGKDPRYSERGSGVEIFRASAIHKAALSESGRSDRVERSKAEFRKRQKSDTA